MENAIKESIPLRLSAAREQAHFVCRTKNHLFMLAQYDDAIPTIVNVEQGIYDIADVQSNGPEQGGEITVQDIISSFGQNEWIEFESIFGAQ